MLTALERAVQKCDLVGLCKCLQRRRVPVAELNSCLETAIALNAADIIKALLKAGANANEPYDITNIDVTSPNPAPPSPKSLSTHPVSNNLKSHARHPIPSHPMPVLSGDAGQIWCYAGYKCSNCGLFSVNGTFMRGVHLKSTSVCALQGGQAILKKMYFFNFTESREEAEALMASGQVPVGLLTLDKPAPDPDAPSGSGSAPAPTPAYAPPLYVK